MGSALIGLAWRQILANKALTAVMGLGVIVAATLLASAPVYARTMWDLGLTYAVRSELSDDATSRVQSFSVPLGTSDGNNLREAVDRRINERVGWFHREGTRIIRLNRFSVVRPGDEGQPFLPLGQPQSLRGYEDHVEVTEGRLPEQSADGVLEVAMGARAARMTRLSVGSTFQLIDRFDNCEREFPEGMTQAPLGCPNSESVTLGVTARLTGIVEALEPDDAFWQGSAARFFDPVFIPLEDAGATTPMFVDEAALTEDFAALFPAYTVESTEVLTIDAERLNRANLDRAREDLAGLRAELDTLGVFLASPLEDTLARFDRSADFQQTPLIVLLLEITAVAVFYVAMIAAIVVERQAGEIALLRGRGATLTQILSVYALQGLILALPAVLVAPFLAGAATALLGLTPPFEDVSGGDLLPATIVPMAFLMAGIGAAVSIAALLTPALSAALRGPTAVRRSLSRPGRSLVQRYYLDLFFAGAAGLLLLELQQRGSVFTPSATGGVSSDPLLLASPALAIFAASMLILRFYPLMVRVLSRAASSAATAPVALGLWQIVRNPGQYTRLALLMMMAIAVGTFAASYTRTAERSYLDRANHEAGVDLRVSESSRTSGAAADRVALEADPTAITGVAAASAVIRAQATLAGPGSTTPTVQVIGLDARTATPLLWFREDYADAPVDELLDRVAVNTDLPGIAIPEGSTALRIWVRAESPTGSMTLRAGIRDANGRFGLMEIGSLADAGADWTPLTKDLAPGALVFTPQEPLTLVSLVFTGSGTQGSPPVVVFDSVVAVGPDGSEIGIEDFEGPSAWMVFPTTVTVADSLELTADSPQSGGQAARFAFRQGRIDSTRGIYVSGLLTPLPAVVSESFVAATGADVGSTTLIEVAGGTLTPLQVRGVFSRFPTTSEDQGPVAIVDRRALLAWTDIAHSGFTPRPQVNELWLSLEPGADEKAITGVLGGLPYRLPNVTSRSAEIASATRNPLIAASGSGILFAAFVGILVLVAVALLTSLLASLKRRQVEMAVVRAIGFTRAQVVAMLAVEYAIVFVTGAVAGCALGLFVSRRMLSFLEVTEAGDRVEPPFILETEWLVVGSGVAGLVIVLAAGLVIASRIIGPAANPQALRTEN